MAESVYLPGLAVHHPATAGSPRHSLLVRTTHWLTALSFLALLVSGIAILVAHPRLYWGETGAVGSPSLVDLPLPFVFGPSGWGRYLHFLSAWVSVLTGVLYVVSGAFTRHFRNHLVPAQRELTWASISQVLSSHVRLRPASDDTRTYNVLQQLAYLGVVFVLFPLMIWTGLAMSPSVTSVLPGLVDALGGQQSARTIHFFAAAGLVLFVLVHILMVCLAGFTLHMRAMITGRSPVQEGHR
jgi:thiosulfate reductase cytochrome b subunit